MMPDHLYLIGDGTGAVKIGRSADPAARLTALQIGSPRALSILHVVPDAGALERAVQRRFMDIHLRREWFDFGNGDPVAAVSAVIGDLQRAQDAAARIPTGRGPYPGAGAAIDPEGREKLRQAALAWAAEKQAVAAERDPLVIAMLANGLCTKEQVHQTTGLGRTTIDRIAGPLN